MKKVTSFQINTHGVDNCQYIQVSSFGTSFDNCALGAGMNEKEAYEDAVNLIASEYETDILPNNPKGINAKNKVPAKMQHEDSDMYFYVSIFYNVEETSILDEMEEDLAERHLFVLKDSNDMILCKELHGKVHFIYSHGKEMTFDFSLLCEVGESYRVIYVRWLKELGLELETVETNTDYFEVIKEIKVPCLP